MSKKLYPEESVQAIADAIRAKTGKTDTMTIGEMAGEVEGIKTSGGLAADDIEQRFIAEGWTKKEDYDADLNKTKLQLYAKDKQYVRNLDRYSGSYIDYMFQDMSNLILDNIPDKGDSIGKYCFLRCTNLALKELPKGVTSIGAYAFYSCTNLALKELPKGVTSIGDHAFCLCTNLALKELPKGVTSIGDRAFEYCSHLRSLRTGKNLKEITGNYAFETCSNLFAFIITNEETVVTLENQNAFYSTPISSNNLGGYIYVPSAIIDSYKTATNWSTYASQFRALEDYTVDGTVDGELDESKI